MDNSIYLSKKIFFEEGQTLPYEFRLRQLFKLKQHIKVNENAIIAALKADLGKPEFEAYTAEVGIVYKEINDAIKNLKKWMTPSKAKTPLFLQPGKSTIIPQPKGVVLIISPWNYPFQLAMSPLIGAIAAGNCVVVKPSEEAFHTSRVIKKIIDRAFNKKYISAVLGSGSKVIPPLIKNSEFDHIFFTGSTGVGKTILSLASDNLTSVTLELGGKSPVIVHRDADLDLAAKRIVWAKFYNCGQTCIAPDYLLVHSSVEKELTQKIKDYIGHFFGKDPSASPSLGRVINEKHFDRLVGLLDGLHVIHGGNSIRDKKYMAPTLIKNPPMDHPLMKEEIFGPILPIITYEQLSEAADIIQHNPYPLSLYLFTKSGAVKSYFLNRIQFGGGCINHLIAHVANSYLPFGGVGYSGMGNYHSKYTFDAFSYYKGIYTSIGSLDHNLLYPPYTQIKLAISKLFLSK